MAWSTPQLAELADTSMCTVRQYHDVGLLAQPERRASGYKSYGVDHPWGHPAGSRVPLRGAASWRCDASIAVVFVALDLPADTETLSRWIHRRGGVVRSR